MNPIFVTKSSMPPFEEYINEIKKLWDNRWLSNRGTIHKQLESELSVFLDAKNVALFANGHVALEVAIDAYNFKNGSEVITTPYTHCSTTHSIVRNNLLPVFCDVNAEDFTIDVSQIENLITDKTVLLTCMLANNEIGTVQPVAELTKLAAEIRTERQRVGNPLPLYVHTDAAQAFNYMNVLPNTLGVDLLVVGGSKIYGPKQTAVLFVKHGVRLEPQVTGGGHEWGLRAGTENVPGIIGLAEAIAETAELRAAESVRLASLQTQFMDGLAQSVPTARINGSRSHRLPNNVHLTIPGLDNETLVMQLDERGIMAAAGSACSASSEEPSHVLRALGLSEAAARSSLRFSMGRDTTDAEITRTLEVLADLCEPTQS